MKMAYFDQFNGYPHSDWGMFCKPCRKDFPNQFEYQRHIGEHENCPFPECGFQASVRSLDYHIDKVHMVLNFDQIQIDDDKWIAERKRRFPSTKRAQLRREKQLERFKRGERLGKSSKFITKRSRPFEFKPNRRKRNYGNQASTSKKLISAQKPKNDYIDYDSESDIRQGVPAFKGTKLLFENVGDMPMFGVSDSHSNGRDLDISDEEEVSAAPSNALTSLMGAYTDSEEDGPSPQIVPPEKFPEVVSSKGIPSVNGVSQSSTPNLGEATDSRRKRVRRPGKRTFDHRNKPQHIAKRRKTLLQRLLEPEVTRERNILLQCCRHIVAKNFFEEVLPLEYERPADGSSTE